jgi:hypothetical protein
MKQLVVFGVVLGLACLVSAPGDAAGTCSGENNKCNAFCATSAGQAQGSSCPNACSRRMQECLVTGTYYWRNSPTKTNLTKR